MCFYFNNTTLFLSFSIPQILALFPSPVCFPRAQKSTFSCRYIPFCFPGLAPWLSFRRYVFLYCLYVFLSYKGLLEALAALVCFIFPVKETLCFVDSRNRFLTHRILLLSMNICREELIPSTIAVLNNGYGEVVFLFFGI